MTQYTDFSGYSHGELRSMVMAMDSGGTMAAGDPWRRAADVLKEMRAALNMAAGDATESWEGTTSNAFYSRMTSLANTVNTMSSYANDAAVAMQIISEAIDQAKRDMPEEPGFWDKVGNAVEDTAKNAVGIDDESTRVSIADQRKAEAAAVVQTLATKYRVTNAYLKPPPPPPYDEGQHVQGPDNSGPEVLGEMIMGAGMAFAASNQGAGMSASVAPRASAPRSEPSMKAPTPTPVKPGPSDPGVKGGTPNPTPEPPAPVKVAPIGPGTNLDGTGAVMRPGGGSAVPTPGATGGTGAPESGGGGFMPGGVGQFGGAAGGRAGGASRLGGAFGASEPESGGAGVGRQAGSGLGQRSNAAAGGARAGAAGRGAFTEGGSGLGRSRGTFGQATGQQQHGMPGDSHAGKKEKKKGKERPDYLVEDEETWASGKSVNPNVVE